MRYSRFICLRMRDLSFGIVNSPTGDIKVLYGMCQCHSKYHVSAIKSGTSLFKWRSCTVLPSKSLPVINMSDILIVFFF